jgi:hypothetical protein
MTLTRYERQADRVYWFAIVCLYSLLAGGLVGASV